jgi:hypothetical protein
LGWDVMAWTGTRQHHCAPQYRGAIAGTWGPVATGHSHLLERVPGAMWMLLVLVPMAGKLGGHRNGDAAVTEPLRLGRPGPAPVGCSARGKKEWRELP